MMIGINRIAIATGLAGAMIMLFFGTGAPVLGADSNPSPQDNALRDQARSWINPDLETSLPDAERVNS
ncbi:MAG: hypothetical protein AAF418_00930, partial [Pseudomonadota bacterium]